MTYQELFDLKYRQGLSTYELIQRYPDEVSRVSQVALLDVPEDTLREILSEEDEFNQLMWLKRRYHKLIASEQD